MAISNQVAYQQYVYFQDTTTNQSFMDMHYILKAKGIKNNKFFLAIYDPDLMGVDPRDPTLPMIMKQKILRECLVNYWYFIREVVRIPAEGGAVTGGVRYKLHRGNLAMNYLFVHNFDQFVDLPRQHFKTYTALAWYLWVFNFGSSNTQMMFINKRHEDSKENLRKMKELRDSLPDYLRMDAAYDRFGKKIKAPNTAETLQHPTNKNMIKTLPAARTKGQADGAGRGCTMAIQYYDEFAFMPYNSIIYAAAYPAFSRAKVNASANHAPYGILITTTPGDLTTDEGVFANQMRLNATMWNEAWYDRTFDQLQEINNSNNDSTFFYVRYTYRQLGSGTEYLNEMIRGMNKDWAKIRREVLLEWSNGSMNCPFAQEDLDRIRDLCRTDPITTIFFGKAGQYQLHVWKQLPIDNRYPPIIGVDVAGAQYQDSSAITIIDSKTTDVLATFNCNYIPSHDLAQIIFELVTKYMKNAIVNIEQNGGFGHSVLGILKDSKIKKNLYYEIKDRVIEERFDGMQRIQKKQTIRSYGTNNNHEVRNNLIELLHNRVKYHKDKFIAPILYQELTTMEVKKNGKTEHAANAHDDQIFSYLMALYVWYYGENLMERFHIFKTELKTDDNYEEDLFSPEERYGGLEEVDLAQKEEVEDIIEEQNEVLKKATSKSMEEFLIEEQRKEQEAIDRILGTADGRKAYAEKYHLDLDYMEGKSKSSFGIDISDQILNGYYGDAPLTDEDIEKAYDPYIGNLGVMYKGIK